MGASNSRPTDYKTAIIPFSLCFIIFHDMSEKVENNKVLFSIDGEDLSIKEREFLKTVEGFQLLINLGKTGFKSIKSLKSDIKHLLSSK